MAGILPDWSGMGLLNYAGLAIGLVIGFSLFQAPADQLQGAISKQG